MHIYTITNQLNDKQYVGQTMKNPEIRWGKHQWDAEHDSPFFIHRAMHKYGIANFLFEIVDECHSIDELNEAEIEWIVKLDTFANGYNLTTGGENYIRSEETKTKMSLGQMGKKYSDETKEKMRQSKLNMSEEYKEKRRQTYSKLAKSVIQIDMITKKTIKEWESTTLASRGLRIHKSCIARVCTGERDTAGGFVWRYV